MGNAKGQVLVETALILPLLLVFVLATVDFSRAMYTKNTLTHAARSGARAAAVTSALSPTSPAALFLATGEPAQSIQRSMPTGIPKDETVQYQLKILDSSGHPVTAPANTGNQVMVILTYPNFPMITPLYKVLSLLTDGASQAPATVNITAEASMRYE